MRGEWGGVSREREREWNAKKKDKKKSAFEM